VKKILKLPVLVALCALFVACTHSARQDTITSAFIATNAARDAYVQYDAAQQDKIVKEATSLDDGKAKLAAYREKRTKYLALFPVVYTSIKVASDANDDLSIKNMQTSLKQLLDAVLPLLGGAL